MQAFVAPTMAISPATAARRAALHHPVKTALQSGYKLVTGVDEAGAGALAGPVVAAAVQLGPAVDALDIPHLDDSKRLSARRRQQAYEALLASDHVTFSLNVCPPHVVDELNVLNARMQAMNTAVRDLRLQPGMLFVDGDRQLQSVDCNQRAIVGADALVSVVAAAGIVAKVVRDRLMNEEAARFPQFAFHRHVGYGTRQHMDELRRFGPCEIHRWSFRPVREAAELHKGARAAKEL